MRVWRIGERRHAASLDGEGARRYGGRWNSRGVAVVYASESIALATLEAFVHVDINIIPRGLVLVAADIPAAVRIADLPKPLALPRNWRSYPAADALKAIGDNWVKTGKTPVLRVPSAVIPESFNYLINPGHVDAAKISHTIERLFAFDSRMLN